MGSKKDVIDNINPYLGAFEEKLIAALHKIFDFKIPFVQTANQKLCSRCPYALICRRGVE
jgi:CRISPR/Cas system-associated exonuclease Cas4 (RecB family)